MRREWHLQDPHFNQKDQYYRLTREEQVIIFRLRTGHNRLFHHMFTKLNIGTTNKCHCLRDITSAEDILQNCSLYTVKRLIYWPKETTLQDKLFGDHESLVRTSHFVKDIEF